MKRLDRLKQYNANKQERALSSFLGASSVAQKIGRSPKVIKLYKNIYNVLCDDCQPVCVGSGGRAAMGEYCIECQEKMKPILKEINDILTQ